MYSLIERRFKGERTPPSDFRPDPESDIQSSVATSRNQPLVQLQGFDHLTGGDNPGKLRAKHAALLQHAMS
jgi:hypothetical protein